MDAEIRALHAELDVFAQLPEVARAKLVIVPGDALGYVPKHPVDFLMPDIWLPLINPTRIAEVRRMQANAQAGAIHFWGQELEIARHAVAAGRALDREGIAATIADIGLPLVGLELDGYPDMLAGAAARHMGANWFGPEEAAAALAAP